MSDLQQAYIITPEFIENLAILADKINGFNEIIALHMDDLEERDAHDYTVVNIRKLAMKKEPWSYLVRIFTNSTGDRIALCPCPARKICKHIFRAVQTDFVIRHIQDNG